MSLRQLLRASLLVAAAIWLAGCAAREVAAVPMSQPGDADLDCPAIAQQIASNSAAQGDFQRKDKKVEQQNTAKGVASAIPYVGALAMASADLSNVEQVKSRSLADRNERLTYLAKQKGCQL